MGLGWAILNANSIKNPLSYVSNRFDNRGNPKSGGGQFSTDSYFSGKAGYFGGFEYFIPKFHGARIKFEYDGTNYASEAKKPINQDSKYNLSYVHPLSRNFFLKLSYVRGNNLSFGFSYRAPLGRKYPFARKTDNKLPVPDKEIIRKFSSESELNLYRATTVMMNERKLYVQAVDLEDSHLKVAINQSKYRIPSISSGRAISILNEISPESVKSFEVMEVNADMGMYSLSLNREDFNKNLKHNNPLLVERYSSLKTANYNKSDFKYVPKASFPAFFYSFGPDLKSQVGGPDGFFFWDLRIAANTELLFKRNFSLISSFSLGLTNNFDDLKLPSDSILPHVRTDIVDYLKEGDGFIVNRMQLNYFLKPYNDLFVKFSGGILESMFGGYGFESLYRPYDKNFAIGLEAWELGKENINKDWVLGSIKQSTGHVTFYYREPNTNVLVKLIEVST